MATNSICALKLMSCAHHRLESARDIVVREWRARRPVQLDTSGAWHRCTRGQCEIDHLVASVCIEGDHIVNGETCTEHPLEEVVHVTDLYACQRIGTIHICDRVSCTVVQGHCSISGLPCAAARATSIEVPATNKRARRKHSGVHTNEQSACILLYDLLFSARRVQYEIKRAEGALDMARRYCQRVIRVAARKRVAVSYQELIDIHVDCRQRLRSVQHIVTSTSDHDRQALCRRYARTFTRVWSTVVSKMPVRCTFESTAAAIMYGMRRGVAYDGILAIPRDPFMASALPDAHAITEVGIARRALTQSKNALYDALQQCIHSSTPVEQFQALFQVDH